MSGVWNRQIRRARSIIAALLKNHGHSLNDEGLRKLAAEAEAIINSRPLTVESLNDIKSEISLSPSSLLKMKSEISLSPSNLLTMKSDIIIPKSGVSN